MSEERTWDFTTLDTFQTCRRKYYWMFIRNLRKKEKSPALLFGGAIHKGLETYYSGGKDLSKAVDAFKLEFTDIMGEELRTVENGTKLLTWYDKIYHEEPIVVVGKPEVGFSFQVGDVMYWGRIDLPAEWDGALWVMEHKTTSKLGSQFFKQFALDKQITGYILALEAYLERKCVGCLVNVVEPWKELKKPTAASKKPEDHFARVPVTRSPMLKDRFKLNVNRLVRDILWCEKENEFYEAEKKEVCLYYNWDCPYKVLCEFGEDTRLIEREYAVEKWQPYLEGVDV